MAIISIGTYRFPVDIYIEECCNCGMPFGMPKEFKDRKREDNTNFCCPAGHSQHYIGKSDLRRARDRASAAERDADHQRAQRRATERKLLTAKQQRGKARAALKRMREDTCPECGQVFERSALTAHLAAVHQVEDAATAPAKAPVS